MLLEPADRIGLPVIAEKDLPYSAFEQIGEDHPASDSDGRRLQGGGFRKGSEQRLRMRQESSAHREGAQRRDGTSQELPSLQGYLPFFRPRPSTERRISWAIDTTSFGRILRASSGFTESARLSLLSAIRPPRF